MTTKPGRTAPEAPIHGGHTPYQWRYPVNERQAASARCAAASGAQEAPTQLQTFDDRRQIIVCPGQIRAGDWLRDLGTLRRVASVEETARPAGGDNSFIIKFEDSPAVPNLSLSIPEAVETVTVWRSQTESDGSGHV